MDNDSKFWSPMALGWSFQVAHMRGESLSTPMERAKRAVDGFLLALRSERQVGQPVVLA